MHVADHRRTKKKYIYIKLRKLKRGNEQYKDLLEACQEHLLGHHHQTWAANPQQLLL